ncbi:hypothetical protein [Brevibacterium spongiae]|uniref:Uncharacterized protein n=1 Tax=Brevibacterium spongiae TaxID=2909672 RepID=A0ABY5SQ06_9MICO|nr:hypothetical protein [Brevibacterium spongiae]UVI34804.1 hypothetical protein L1F31_11775 [Brevibacterium spongiae]
MGRFAIIPAAPVLLDDIDRSESDRIGRLRATIHGVLRAQDSWALPVESLPPVAGLGGWGIDRGLDTRNGRLLAGTDWVQTVESLTDTERDLAEAADSAIIVALLHAHAAGVTVGPVGSSANLLVPIDLSGASAADAPLAPVDGAADFDSEVVSALTATPGDFAMDTDALLNLCARAESMHANLSVLAAGVRLLVDQGARMGGVELDFDERIHEVRSLCGTGSWT